MKFTRRHFLAGGTALLGALGLGRLSGLLPFRPAEVRGEILGASSKIGHQLRGGVFPEPSETVQKDIVIVGGGIAGLAAGYRLHKAGVKNFILLELESEAGGNATSGKNDVSAYPWGAHYVPLLTEESRAVSKLFQELGIITGHDSRGLPIYNEYFLCSDLHERLFMYGRWQDGLVPNMGLSDEDKKQYTSFFSIMDGFKSARGGDGRKAFAIPVDYSSQDQTFLKYDVLTMKEWMVQNGFTSAYLQWYVNYCCRDDYGTTFDETSAWAGMHYFSSRTGIAANATAQDVITWPEGNGWLAHKLMQPLEKNIISHSLAYRIRQDGSRVTVDYLDTKTGISRRISAESVILATPQFIAARLLPPGQETDHVHSFSYAPWVVANITLDKIPEGRGVDLAWDNMIYNSPLLGYVVATHQNTEMKPLKTVITYYWPLSHLSPPEARQDLLQKSYEDLRDIFLQELLVVHPDLKGHIEKLDLWIWGHAMVRPTKGFIWEAARRAVLRQKPPIFHAHSDMSGISIFEEAYTHGVRAAENSMTYLKIPYGTEL